MVDERVIAFIKSRSHELFGNRHAHCVSEALPQRSRSCLYTRRIAIFRVSGRFAVELSEVFNVIDREIVAR